MSKQDNLEIFNPQSLVEDLPVSSVQAAELKGGPLEIKELTIKVRTNEQGQ
jgi:hypothetical protein